MSERKASGITVASDGAVILAVPVVTWYKHAGLRKIYLMMPILMWLTGSLSWLSELSFTVRYRVEAPPRVNSELISWVVVSQVNRGMFVSGRFLVGFGSNISIGAAPLLIMELAYSQHRGKLTTLYNTLWYVGSIIAAWTVYGTIKYRGHVSWRVPVAPVPVVLSQAYIDLYASQDGGLTWEFVSHIAYGAGPETIQDGNDAIWEPFLLMHEGQLICYYSDQRDPLHAQKLLPVTTTDLRTWSEPVDDVAHAEFGNRPGMAIVAHIESKNRWIMTYEICGPPGCVVNYKVSDSPLTFGSAPDTPLVVGNVVPYGSPYVIWTPHPDRTDGSGLIIMNGSDREELFINEDAADPNGWRMVNVGQWSVYSRELNIINVEDEKKLMITNGGNMADGSLNYVVCGVVDDLKDVIQHLFEIQSAVHGYLGPETQQELVRKIKSLTLSLSNLSEHSRPDPSLPPSTTAPRINDPDPALHTVQLPPEIIDYVDSARNPDIYTREFVELVQKGNQDLKGKAEAFASFRDVLAREMTSAMPECKGEVERVVRATGGGDGGSRADNGNGNGNGNAGGT
ncbi:hypothetical protein FQN53_001096 [Emmonsiellopsis sp. PD_33]|nr:hypothetical protein FQN53_001096 [Emmonsiellopsis sp. PD_33]